jgi:hypothetical protein
VFLVPGLKSKDPSADGAKAFGEFFARHYHRPSDDVSLPIDLSSVERFVRANVLVTHAIASDRRAPQWKPGNFFGRTFGQGQAKN